MRGARSTSILLIILLGLFGYIYFIESKAPATSEGETTKEKAIAVEADKIQELTVKGTSGEAAMLQKTGAGWQLVEPTKAKADSSEVSGVVTSLASLQVERVVEEAPSDLKQYGLASPRIDVGFKTASDKDFRHLLIGSKTATGGDLYARLGNQKKVFLISGYLEGTFNRAPFDLRDKTILAFDRDKVDSLGITGPDRKIELAKSETEWKITQPVQARADFGTVEGLVGRVGTAQMKSIVASEPVDLKQYGLETPVVTVTLGSGSSRAGLAVGKKADEGAVYARDLSRPMVFTIESSLADELKKDASEYRRKDIFEFRPFTARRFEVTREGKTVAFDKVKGSSKDTTEKWRQTMPTAREVDSTKLDGILSKLSNLRAQSFADPAAKTGLDAPVATILVRYDEGRKEERVKFGKSGSDLYVARADEPGAAKVETIDFDQAMKDLDELTAPPVQSTEKK